MSKRRLVDRKRIRCQGLRNREWSLRPEQCENRATGYVRIPAKRYVCPECRWLEEHPTAMVAYVAHIEELPNEGAYVA